MHHIFTVHSSYDNHQGWFHFLIIVDWVVMSMDAQVSLQQEMEYFEIMPMSSAAGSQHRPSSSFEETPISIVVATVFYLANNEQGFLLPTFLVAFIVIYFLELTCSYWNLKVVLIFISMMLKKVEHFKNTSQSFVFCLFFDNTLFSSKTLFKIGLFSWCLAF